jgi:PAS domain S-box-containing protein
MVDEAMARMLAAGEQLAQMGSWHLDFRTGSIRWSDQMYRLLGFEPQTVEPTPELLLAAVHPDDRQYAEEVLERALERPETVPEAGLAVELRVVRPDGTVRNWRALGRVERDASGAPARWLGSAQDITDQQWSERELRAHQALGTALADWEAFEPGVTVLLRRLARALDFPLAVLWTCQDERIAARAVWRQAGVGEDFEAATRRQTFAPRQGLIGRVWQDQAAAVASDLSGVLIRKARTPAGGWGLQSGVVLPAVCDGETLAVLSFYSVDRHEFSDRLVRTLAAVGVELGRYLGRRRAELLPGTLTAREREILVNAASGKQGPAIARQLGIAPATVKSHFEHIYAKLGVGDRSAAVAHGLRTGLIE